jgi:hypothetical protein
VGLQDSVEAFSNAAEGSTPKDVMMLVLVTQYLDTMKEIGANDKSNTILTSHSPGAVGGPVQADAGRGDDRA